MNFPRPKPLLLNTTTMEHARVVTIAPPAACAGEGSGVSEIGIITSRTSRLARYHRGLMGRRESLRWEKKNNFTPRILWHPLTTILFYITLLIITPDPNPKACRTCELTLHIPFGRKFPHSMRFRPNAKRVYPPPHPPHFTSPHPAPLRWRHLQVVRQLPSWIAERVVKPANFGGCFVSLRRFFAEMHGKSG